MEHATCGTLAGYRRHTERRGEPPCDGCLSAAREAWRDKERRKVARLNGGIAPSERRDGCIVCGTPITRTRRRGAPVLTCSPACRNEHVRRRHRLNYQRRTGASPTPTQCLTCSATLPTPHQGRRARCEPCAKEREAERSRRQNHERRSKLYGTAAQHVDRLAIYKRDRWTCQLCGKQVNPTHQFPDPRSHSLDHVIPLSVGGTHDPANVQLTHLGCNMRKGTRPAGEQLRLIG